MKKIFTLIIIIFLTTSLRAQWVNSNNVNGTIYSINYLNNTFFCTSYSGVYKSNDGMNWVLLNNGLPNKCIKILKYYNKLIVCTNNSIDCSDDNGNSWHNINGAIPGGVIQLFVYNEKLFAAAPAGYYVCSDTTFNWIFANNALSNFTIQDFIVHNNILFAATYTDGVYSSTNDGLNWQPASYGITTTNVYALCGSNNKLYAATHKGIFMTTNNGFHWDSLYIGLQGKATLSILLKDSILIASTPTGIYISPNWGQNWYQKNQGISPVQFFFSMFYKDNYIYGGGQYGFVWRRLLSEAVGVQNLSINIPDEFKLYQNYPNPFNPETNIRFDIAKQKSFVRLSVYDVTGREVALLVNETMNPGTYEYTFNAGNLSSGIYFYKLSSGNFTDVKKLTVIK